MDEQGKMYKCGFCIKSYGILQNLKSHQIEIHQSLLPEKVINENTVHSNKNMPLLPLPEERKGSEVTSKNLEIREDQTSEQTSINRCTKCSQTFLTKTDLNVHYIEIHQKKLKCSICDTTFLNQGTLTKHMKQIHGQIFKIYLCKNCNQKFDSVQSFTLHKKSSNCAKKHKCDQCYRSFGNSHKLKTHIWKTHQKQRENITNMFLKMKK